MSYVAITQRIYRLRYQSQNGNEPAELLCLTTNEAVWQWVAELRQHYPRHRFWVEVVETTESGVVVMDSFIADTLDALAASEAGEQGVPFEEVKQMAERGESA